MDVETYSNQAICCNKLNAHNLTIKEWDTSISTNPEVGKPEPDESSTEQAGESSRVNKVQTSGYDNHVLEQMEATTIKVLTVEDSPINTDWGDITETAPDDEATFDFTVRVHCEVGS